MTLGKQPDNPERAFLGVKVAPVNWHYTAPEAGYIFEDSEAGVVFADPAYADVARAAARVPVLVAGDEAGHDHERVALQ